MLKYANEIGIDYPMLMGEQEGYEAAERFGVASLVLPFSVFADSQGRIVTLKIGELHADEAAVHPRPREGCGRQSASCWRMHGARSRINCATSLTERAQTCSRRIRSPQSPGGSRAPAAARLQPSRVKGWQAPPTDALPRTNVANPAKKVFPIGAN